MESDSNESDDLVEANLARVGKTIAGKWLVESLLGVGGMGAVYAARHRNGKAVAMKVLHAHLALQSQFRKRFLREGHVANAVGHPGAVSVLDDGTTEDGEVFLVMELLDGETLDARFSRAGRLSLSDAAAICVEVLDVLSAAHAKQIVHRDIKPENVFLTSDGEVKVLDFGIASLRDAAGAGSLATKPGTARGTPAFMAPEQARGAADVDGRADVWAVGAMLFTLVVGRTVHEGSTAMETMFLAGTRAAPTLASVYPDVPPAFAAIVDRALAFAPEERWQSALDMAGALRTAAGGATRGNVGNASTMPAGPTVSVASRRSMVPVVAVLAVLGLVSLAAFAMRRDDVKAPPLASSTLPVASATSSSVAPALSIAPPAEPSASIPAAAPSASEKAAGEKKPRPPSTTKAAAPPKPDCDPPYVIDANGHRRFKAQCL